MKDPPEGSDRQLEFLQELEEENVWIDGDVLEIDKDRWAIHGVIPYDGEVEIAVFNTYEEARHFLDGVQETPRPPSDP